MLLSILSCTTSAELRQGRPGGVHAAQAHDIPLCIAGEPRAGVRGAILAGPRLSLDAPLSLEPGQQTLRVGPCARGEMFGAIFEFDLKVQPGAGYEIGVTGYTPGMGGPEGDGLIYEIQLRDAATGRVIETLSAPPSTSSPGEQ
ncbi:MAG: hypothetical protein PVI30_04495 [Myxococcales bacterium]|jgi:hypothetical protein